jgi:GNAT superfamily N-acetyltransferase
MASEAAYQVVVYFGSKLPPEYHNLVLSKWMRSFRYGNDYIKLIDADSYFDKYSRYIRAVLALSRTVVRMAALKDDDDVVLGFSVITNSTLQYVHVHKDMRRQGIGRRLVPDYVDSFTHLTRTAAKLWPTKMAHAKFIIY